LVGVVGVLAQLFNDMGNKTFFFSAQIKH